MKILEKLWGGQALTFEQFTEALGAASDIKLVNLADGGYVSKDKFDAKDTELTTANNTIKTLQDTVRKFDGVDVEKLKNDAKNWETKYNDDMSEAKRRIYEALIQDDRITDVDSWVFSSGRKWVTVSFVVHTIYGDVEAEKEIAA